MVILEKRSHFIGFFERGGAILLGKFVSKLVVFFIYVQNYTGGGLEFHIRFHALPGGWSSRSSYFIEVA